MTQYFGKYRGKVEVNADPFGSGRLQVSCPAVFGSGTNNWALPCVPYAASGKGFYFIPPVGANVWIEFEGGNKDTPIWSGCFWGNGEAPALIAEQKIIKTDAFTLTITDVAPGLVKIETTGGMKIEFSATGVSIANGQGATVELSGPKVSVNGTALEVT